MSLNAFLHPRNPYRERPDFKALATKYPEFRKSVSVSLDGKVKLDFSDREAVRVLTETLLAEDFGLRVEIPKGCLVPTLPLRMNYLLWIEDLLQANGVTSGEGVLGLDIGVGAACIYPTLAAAGFKWSMMGIEADQENLVHARKNVERNQDVLGSRIAIFDQPSLESEASLFLALAEGRNGEVRCLFSMCNPPFHHEDNDDGEAPGAASTSPSPAGKDAEMRTRGGEVAFLSKMVADSVALVKGGQVAQLPLFFTSMVGHKSSVKAVRKVIEETAQGAGLQVHHSTTEFCQGRTMRWGIVWSFNSGVNILDSEQSLLKKRQAEKKMHKPMTFKLAAPLEEDCKSIFSRLTEFLKTVDFAVKPGKMDADKVTFTAKTFSRSWQNQRRKRREKQRAEEETRRKAEEAEAAEPQAKRSRLEAEPMDTDANGEGASDKPAVKEKGDVQLCCKFFLQKTYAHPDFIEGEALYLDGEVGRDGLQQIIQFLINKNRGL